MSRGGAAGLFLAVYTSNTAIRLFFLPFCYALLASPFALVLAIYGPFAVDNPQRYVPFLKYVVPRVSLLFVVLAGTMRVLSYLNIAIAATEENPKTLPPRPYWLNSIEHLPDVTFGGERFWTRSRDSSKYSIFGLLLSGTKHNVVVSPQTAKMIEGSNSASVSRPFGREIILRNVFGLHLDKITVDELLAIFSKQLLESSFKKQVLRRFEQDLPNLTSFMPTLIDQMPWERTAGVDVEESSDGKVETAKTSLHSIVSEFLTYIITTSLLGSAFTNNYPQFATDLATLSSSFYTLAVNLPRWFPVPGIVPAHSARRNLMNHLTFYHNTLELDSSGESTTTTYGDLSDISPLFLELIKDAKVRGLSPDDRAKATLALLFHTIDAVVPPATLLLVHLLDDSKRSADEDLSVLHTLRTDVASYARALQTAPILGISEPPTIKFSSTTSLLNAPTLKASLIETIRLDYCAWRVLMLNDDLEVPDQDGTSTKKKSDGTVWKFRQNEWLHIAGALYNSSPEYFPNAGAWEPARHTTKAQKESLISQETATAGSNEESLKWSSVSGPDWATDEEDEKPFAELVVAFVVGTLSLWDVEMLGGKSSEGKGAMTPGGWREVDKSLRVALRRRKLAA